MNLEDSLDGQLEKRSRHYGDWFWDNVKESLMTKQFRMMIDNLSGPHLVYWIDRFCREHEFDNPL